MGGGSDTPRRVLLSSAPLFARRGLPAISKRCCGACGRRGAAAAVSSGALLASPVWLRRWELGAGQGQRVLGGGATPNLRLGCLALGGGFGDVTSIFAKYV